MCQAVRAPGVKWTMAAASRDGPVGTATESIKTSPVNQSFGPGLVWSEFLVICIRSSSCCGSVLRQFSYDRIDQSLDTTLQQPDQGPVALRLPWPDRSLDTRRW